MFFRFHSIYNFQCNLETLPEIIMASKLASRSHHTCNFLNCSSKKRIVLPSSLLEIIVFSFSGCVQHLFSLVKKNSGNSVFTGREPIIFDRKFCQLSSTFCLQLFTEQKFETSIKFKILYCNVLHFIIFLAVQPTAQQVTLSLTHSLTEGAFKNTMTE